MERRLPRRHSLSHAWTIDGDFLESDEEGGEFSSRGRSTYKGTQARKNKIKKEVVLKDWRRNIKGEAREGNEIVRPLFINNTKENTSSQRCCYGIQLPGIIQRCTVNAWITNTISGFLSIAIAYHPSSHPLCFLQSLSIPLWGSSLSHAHCKRTCLFLPPRPTRITY